MKRIMGNELNKHKIKMSERTRGILLDIDCYTDNINELIEESNSLGNYSMTEETEKIKNALRKLGIETWNNTN